MSLLTSLARLRALDEGIAQPIATVRHCHLSARPMVFIPLKLSGEAAAPLAAMLGTDRDEPRLLVVPQPRNRDLRFAWAAELAGVLVPYIETFLASTETVERKNADPYERAVDAPQLIVPNRAGVAFTRLLGRSTRFRSLDGPYPVPMGVPLLGRWLTYFAERAAYPGSSLTLCATDELGRHWASGQSALEDANLAALVAWITDGAERRRRGPADLAARGTGHRSGFRRRGARAGDRERVGRTRHRGAAHPARTHLAAHVAGARPAARPAGGRRRGAAVGAGPRLLQRHGRPGHRGRAAAGQA